MFNFSQLPSPHPFHSIHSNMYYSPIISPYQITGKTHVRLNITMMYLNFALVNLRTWLCTSFQSIHPNNPNCTELIQNLALHENILDYTVEFQFLTSSGWAAYGSLASLNETAIIDNQDCLSSIRIQQVLLINGSYSNWCSSQCAMDYDLSALIGFDATSQICFLAGVRGQVLVS
jgi:hypothetical protein